ncbi:hypothetical protein AMTRI_Chr08g203420 [Amborella trichopoda]
MYVLMYVFFARYMYLRLISREMKGWYSYAHLFMYLFALTNPLASCVNCQLEERSTEYIMKMVLIYITFPLSFYFIFFLEDFCSMRCGHGLQSKEYLLNHLHEVESFNYDCSAPWGDDKYLQPFSQDDALLHSYGGDGDDDDVDFYDATFLPDEIDPMVEVVNVDEGLMKNVIDEEGMDVGQSSQVPSKKSKDKSLKVSSANVMAREIQNVNEGHFGSYSSFSIHKEMISYKEAILGNPTLMNQATVMDVGCGTGILSLFAAQAGASRLFAIEASEKMASVAKQIAKDNGLLKQNGEPAGAIDVMHGMCRRVLLSEWMGSYARDLWLKPGGAILPDTATIFVAGFGSGGTSFPLWEDLHGFDKSCIGKEVTEDAAQLPIVDIVDSQTLVTDPCVLRIFDLVTMRREDMDFTANFELTPKSQNSPSSSPNTAIWCYGVVLWFDTGFTSRFCKETPTILSTSPFGPKTHWSQTLLTFKESIALFIARASRHKSIDVSMEITVVGHDGGTQTFLFISLTCDDGVVDQQFGIFLVIGILVWEVLDRGMRSQKVEGDDGDGGEFVMMGLMARLDLVLMFFFPLFCSLEI